MEKQIQHRYSFAHPPERVWEFLTQPALMEQWLMKNDFQPIVGYAFQFRTNPIASLNFDGIFYCTVLELVPCKKLSYSWNCGPGAGKIDLQSVVVWKLLPTEKGTDLLLNHSGFARKENLDFYNGLYQGWLEKFQKIEKLINTVAQPGTTA